MNRRASQGVTAEHPRMRILARAAAPLLAFLLSALSNHACIEEETNPEQSNGQQELTDLLETVEGLNVVNATSRPDGSADVELLFEQPADHDNPDGERFAQRLLLRHRSLSAPMVLVTSGYYIVAEPTHSELTGLLHGNQLIVEHRFFEPSRPPSEDWSLLTIEQAAADHHRLVEALRPHYTGVWVSSGTSKGGMTAIFHRRFYPDDVHATVAYVAPLSLDLPDTRYLGVFDTLGDADCRQALKDLQREALLRRDRMAELARAYADRNGLSFGRQSADEAIESAAVELAWTFWQYGSPALCETLPGAQATDEEIFDYLDLVDMFWTHTDWGIALFEPYYYQSFTQLGYPTLDTTHLDDLLSYDIDGGTAAWLPAGVSVSFDPSTVRDVDAWVQSEGSRLMLVYGANDPWTAGAFELGGAADSYRFIVSGMNHSANLLQMPEADRTDALQTLERWTGVEVDANATADGALTEAAGHVWTTPVVVFPAR